MKIVTRIFSLFILAGTVLFLSNCGKDEAPTKTAEEQQLDKLKGTWDLTSVSLDGSTRSDFTDVVMVIGGTYQTNGTYTYHFTTGGTFPNPSPWPKKTSSSPGTWKFGAEPLTQLIRLDDDPDLPMNYNVTATTLQITFNYTGAGYAGGKTEEVQGNWEFNFTKQ